MAALRVESWGFVFGKRCAHAESDFAPPPRTSMPLTFTRSWNDEDLERYRDSVVRFIEAEMLPDDEAARGRGHVGHALWRRAGELGFLCADIPEAHGGSGGDFRHEAVFYEEMARRGLTGM